MMCWNEMSNVGKRFEVRVYGSDEWMSEMLMRCGDVWNDLDWLMR